MKKVSLLLVVSCLIAAPAFAETSKLSSGETKSMEEMFSKCDTNGDGKISKEEYQKEKMELFSKWDKNSDGNLSKEEHRQMAVHMHDKMMNKDSVARSTTPGKAM